eukprot:7050425-Prymnesium_polylepis.1
MQPFAWRHVAKVSPMLNGHGIVHATLYPRTKKESLKYYIIILPLLRKSSSRFAGGGPNETSPSTAIGCINDPNRIHHDGPPGSQPISNSLRQDSPQFISTLLS